MKKNILIILSILFLTQISFASESITNEITKMPTDEEIMTIIEKYGLNEEQKQSVFKDTKKKLQQMYEENKTEKNNKLEKLQN